MWELQTHCLEIILRSAILYGTMLFLFRLSKRQSGELSPMDIVVLTTVGNLAASAALKSDDSVSAAMIAIATFVFLGIFSEFVTSNSRLGRRILEGTPTLLVHNGKFLEKGMNKENVCEADVMESIRAAGLASIQQVHAAIIETNGKISVIAKDDTTAK
ncbi:DUF421 domain-containing protein [Candidatus Obscuribacterales bacterium]|nr:DUF421 domain-containing protein [Candidatus Obscuribacterales bacterium]